MKACDRHIIETLKLTNAMIDLADRGDAEREDTGCGILYGILRDSAYKIMALAESEKQKHVRKTDGLNLEDFVSSSINQPGGK